MSISATYIQLREQIADELGDRTDLLSALSDSGLSTSPIANAVQSAVSKWEREPFYFNEVYSVSLFNTVVGQEFYTSSAAAAVATMPQMKKLHVLISGNRYPMEPRSWQYLEDISLNANVTGQPFEYAYFAEQLRFYPIPDNVYPITISAIQRIANLVNDNDTNVWTQDGFDLIRSEAKLILAREVLHDPQLASEMMAAIYGPGGYLPALKGESARRGKSKIRPTHF